ncbi:MAG: toxic anion resistance protein, partial [Eubacteriales bacterium]|nr:toxic anion resistance protein [Eubacteriales bacterium]
MADEFKDFQDTAPTLSFGDDAVKEDPKADEKNDLLAQIADIQTDIKKEETNLSPKEIEQVDSFVEQIDLTNSNAILNYGAGTQKKIADFSQRALDNVRTKDMGATGEMITKLVTDLKNFDVDENEKGIKAFFKKKANKMEIMRAKYAKIETNVNDISNQLEEKQVQLMKDTALLDKMYQM